MFITPLSDSFSVCFYVSAKKHLQVQFLKAFCGQPDLACFVTINYNKKKQKLISVFSNFNMSCFCESPFCKMFWRPPEAGGHNLVTVWESWGLGLIWKVLILPIKTRGWWLLYSPYDLWIVHLAMEGLYMICRSHWDVSIIKVVQLPLLIKSEILMFLSKSSEVTVSHPARAHLYGTFCNLDFRNKRKL